MKNYWINNISKLQSLIEKYGSPIYVYSKEIIDAKYRILQEAFTDLPYQIHYAMKANENKEILSHIKKSGLGVDVVSPNEIERALKTGFTPSQIVFTPSCPDDRELKMAFDNQVKVHIGAVEYLDFVLKNYPNRKIGLRINPGNSIGGNQKIATAHQDSKFGIPYTQLETIQSYIQQGLQVDALHIHTGSDVKTWQDLARSVDVIFDFARHFNNLKYIDLGSGFKVAYQPGDTTIDLKAYARHIKKRLNEFPYPVQIKFEPGKFLISEAGVLLTKVTIVKNGFVKKFAGVNSGFHHLIRPMYYDAYHEIINISNPDDDLVNYDVVGQLCEEDTFAYGRKISRIRKGDILMIMNAGAYGFSMSMEYNLRTKPPEIFI
jgi:diaminopimelate decarboxylase